ncbi:four helix bundle protein [Stratiformator vulcanicus]|uniref:four helix bundle protein n=1 Tax=Stratiformator vulcanicus TaxID=2527980 RepID=UPI0035C6FE78
MSEKRQEADWPTFAFERLDAWQVAMSFADEVYRVTRKFPNSEQFGLVSQMRRAAVSVGANIAEGNARTGPRDEIRFLEISYSSLMEVISHSVIAHRQGFPSDSDCCVLRQTAFRCCQLISGLRRSKT